MSGPFRVREARTVRLDAVKFDPIGAVGWRDIALDGLTCYHRCVEAVLRGAGFVADEIVEELGGAVTDQLGAIGRPFLHLRDSRFQWLIAAPGEDHWGTLRSRIDHGRPVIVWPDRYWLPGDSCEGRRHVHNHAVLALRTDGEAVVVLDIDADEDKGFERRIAITADSKRAFTRLLELSSIARGEPLQASEAQQLITDSAGPLARFADAADTLRAAWSAGPDRRFARAADLWILGDIQPQVYLFACICDRTGHEELAALGFQVATQTKKISLFLAGLRPHRPRTPYDLCLDDLATLATILHDLASAARREVGLGDPPRSRPDDRWFWRRVDTLSHWHFAAGLGLSQSPAAIQPGQV